MSVAYYLACLEIGQYIWVGDLAPNVQTIPENPSGAISRFALAHRGKALTVVNDTHAIIDEGAEWKALSKERPVS
ncbi:hypothetical protein [Chromobacterium piscinae]|uniref:hypothetical protein n=1 Tax=Chromobacterium piscinae TaxID=686831 RepID=UPI003F7D5EFC